jgi:hypothetical protein
VASFGQLFPLAKIIGVACEDRIWRQCFGFHPDYERLKVGQIARNIGIISTGGFPAIVRASR